MRWSLYKPVTGGAPWLPVQKLSYKNPLWEYRQLGRHSEAWSIKRQSSLREKGWMKKDGTNLSAMKVSVSERWGVVTFVVLTIIGQSLSFASSVVKWVVCVYSVAIRPKPKKGGKVSSNVEDMKGYRHWASNNAKALSATLTLMWICVRAKCNTYDSFFRNKVPQNQNILSRKKGVSRVLRDHDVFTNFSASVALR